ncbi:33376_t:CDS:2, partial [Racocetra persica]
MNFGDTDLTNIKIVTLPLKTTSKLQPMNSDIIAAFKHHYRHFLLQHALDCDKAEEFDIYKNVTNCFCHTGLFDYEISPTIHEVHPNNENSSVIADLEELLRLLSPCHSISLAYYTNSPEEMDMVHQEFTDADLLES